VRYLLEVAETVAEAISVLTRVPVNMAYNLTLLDKHTEAATAFVAPGTSPEISDLDAATNHRGTVPDWPEHGRSWKRGPGCPSPSICSYQSTRMLKLLGSATLALTGIAPEDGTDPHRAEELRGTRADRAMSRISDHTAPGAAATMATLTVRPSAHLTTFGSARAERLRRGRTVALTRPGRGVRRIPAAAVRNCAEPG
jgi:Acyl-coenzyme A:6-aminopenicillanic acid acyl-transferase